MDGSIIMWSSLQNLIYVLFRPENIPYTLLVSGCIVRDFSAQRKENNTPRVRVFTRWRKPLEYTISLSKRVRVEAYPSCFAQANKINICTLNWLALHVSFHINYSAVNHFLGRLKSERYGWIGVNTTNFIWVVSRGLGPCQFTDTWYKWPITSQAIVVVTFVGGQFHVVKVAFNFNRVRLMVSSLTL